MPGLSQADRARLPAIRDSLKRLVTVVEIIQAGAGLTQAAVARAMGVNQGYLSELLKDPDSKQVSVRKLEGATRGLRALTDHNESALLGYSRGQELMAALAWVEEEWGWPAMTMAQPGEIVGAEARNYVWRSCDADLESRIGQPSTILITGGIQSGRTTLVRRCADLAARKTQVAYVDLASSPTSEPPAFATIGSTLAPRADCSDWTSVTGVLGDWLRDNKPRVSTLILDGINSGSDPRTINDLLNEVAIWHRNRVVHPAIWSGLAIWCVMTSREVTDARYHSAASLSRRIGSSNSVDLRWWLPDEVQDFVNLYPLASKTGSPTSFPSALRTQIWTQFHGQPFLTHAGVTACSATGQDVDTWLKGRPAAVHTHLKQLSGLIATNVDAMRVITLKLRDWNDVNGETVGSGHRWSPLLDELQVAAMGEEFDWSCELYRRELPRYLSLQDQGAPTAPGRLDER